MKSGLVKSAFWLLLAIFCFGVAAVHVLDAAREAGAVFTQTFFFVWHELLDDQLFNVVLLALLGIYALSRIRALRRDAAKLALTPGDSTSADAPMASVRAQIDVLDDQLVALLARRQDLIRTAASIKRTNGIPARVPERVDEVLRRVALRAEAEALDVALSQSLWRDIIEWSIAYEERLINPAVGVTGVEP